MQGKQLSAYKITSDLGSGGMGKVYRAEVVDEVAGLAPGTLVALKVIHSHLLEKPGFFKRFLREAQVGQRVDDENVVKTYDCDATLVDGVSQHFLVMEYVAGQTLRDLLQELGRVPEELCRHIGREVAKGLSAIHDAGVVHRDIKPENVLITETHVVKVMDLGVARLQDEVIRLSQAGTFVGSVEYAAPEQFRSEGEPPDHRADLHALGVVLYELATGQHPHRDEDMHKMLQKILNDEPRRAGEVNPQLSPFFEEVIHTLLAKQRDARFQSAAEVVDVLEDGEGGAWWTERAKALRIETKQPLRRMRVPRETALYGRDDDLTRLHALFDKVKSGDGQVLLVEGEAGIGKTRLVDEFVGRLRQEGEELNFLFGSYPPGGAATVSGAFSTAYREQFGTVGLEETLTDYLEPTPVLIPSFAALLRGESTPAGAEPLTKDSLQTVFVHATRGLAVERPTIVLIDDLHFSPEEGHALFASLAMAIPGHRVLLVGTSRPGMAEDYVANLDRSGHFSRMALSRLGPKDLFRLLQDSFRSERLAEQLGMQVSVKSDGNPFFAFEIIRGLREGQFIRQTDDGTWVSTQVIKEIQIPSSITDLIQARLRDLSEAEKDLLDVASCCGFEFDPSVLAAVSGLALIPALKSLARIEKAHRLIRSAGMAFVFDHHQVQESLYEGLPGMLRQEYHAAIAGALEAREGATAEDPKALDGALSVELFEHFLKGGRGARALRYMDPALDHLAANYLNDQMIALAEQALGVEGLLEGRARVEILLRLNNALQTLGRREAQETLFVEAVALAETTGNEALVARVLSARGFLFNSISRYDSAQTAYEAALELAQRVGNRELQTEAQLGLGTVFTHLGRYEEATSQLEQGRLLAREIGDQKGEAGAAGALGVVFWRQGRNDEAIRKFERNVEVARALGDRRSEAAGTGCLGLVFMAQGQGQTARQQTERALGSFRKIGDRLGEAVETGNMAVTFWNEGFGAEALEWYRRARAMNVELGFRRDEAVTLHNEGLVLASLGSPEEAQACQQAALDISREISYRFLEALALMELAGGLKDQDDLEAAERHYREALAHIEALGSRDQHAGEAHLRYGELLALVGRPDEGRTHLDEALAIANEAGAPALRVLALLHLALMEAGDPVEAGAVLDEAEALVGHTTRIDARFLLYQATGNKQHLEAARDLLTFLVEHAPDTYRETTVTNVRLHRDILKAWAEHQAAS